MSHYSQLSPEQRRAKLYSIFSCVVICLIAFTFLFPLYWIITGSFKTKTEILSSTPVWVPSEWVMTNYENLMSKRTAPLFDFSLFGYTITGPTIPGAIRWLLNTVVMSVSSMLLTCLTAAMAGYALAKKRFYGRTILFSLIVCAMALPKQVILIPLVREMSALNLYDTIWSVIIPIVGWPFGVFLLKQFAEGIPTEMVDDYFMQLIMLMSTKELTISVGIATMQGENSTDFGILMAGSALASVPIIIVFLIFQKYFTKGITMGAVKG